MSYVEQLKYSTSPYNNDDEGILLVDLETESTPMTDADGNLLYYSISGGYTYALNEDNDE